MSAFLLPLRTFDKYTAIEGQVLPFDISQTSRLPDPDYSFSEKLVSFLGCFNEFKTLNNLFKSLNVLVKVEPLSSVIIEAIKPFICNKSVIDAFNL